MEAILARLESVTSRLERYQQSTQGDVSAATTPAPRSHAPSPRPMPPPPATPAARPPVVEAAQEYSSEQWEAFLANEVGACTSAAQALPEECRGCSELFVSGAKLMVDIVNKAQNMAKPAVPELTALVQPLGETIQQAEALTRGAKTPSTNHKKAVVECLQGFAWITFDTALGAPTPAAALGESFRSAEMFLNRIIMEHREGAPEHKVWVQALKAAMLKLTDLATQHFPQGLVWGAAAASNAKPSTAEKPKPASKPEEQTVQTGTGASKPTVDTAELDARAQAPETDATEPGTSAKESAPPAAEPAKSAEPSSAALPAPAAPPPPPPVPPVEPLLEKMKAGAGDAAAGEPSATAALMSQLNRGADVTKRLKKVTSDMKTKNMPNRQGVVKARQASPTKAAAKGPPVKQLQQTRWIVENWVACDTVELAEGDVKRSHAVYVSNCADCVIQVKGKVNTVMLDNCSKVGLVFSSVVSTVELVNCKSCKVQCESTCPTLNIDKTDGAQVYLSEEAAEATEVVTSKSSSVVVTVLSQESEADPVEHTVPEQFVSKMVDGKLVTKPASHI